MAWNGVGRRPSYSQCKRVWHGWCLVCGCEGVWHRLKNRTQQLYPWDVANGCGYIIGGVAISLGVCLMGVTFTSMCCLSSFSSLSEFFASPLMTSTGPFSSWLLIARYRMNRGSPTCSWRQEMIKRSVRTNIHTRVSYRGARVIKDSLPPHTYTQNVVHCICSSSIKVAGQGPLPIFMRSNDFSNLYIKSLLGLSN